MRVSCLQENLAKGLSIVSRAVSSRSTLPVLGNILLEAKDGQLRLAATNLEIGINCWIGAKVDDEGATTVPAKLLGEFVNSLPAERIDMELTVRTQTLHLRCAQYDANIRGIDAAEFPIIPTADGGDTGLAVLEDRLGRGCPPGGRRRGGRRACRGGDGEAEQEAAHGRWGQEGQRTTNGVVAWPSAVWSRAR